MEIIKQDSDYLRHPLMEELVNEASSISEDAVQLMKFHGSYMQDDRDKRNLGKGKFYQFMMRTRQPGGLVTNQLYLTMDDLADEFGNGTLRLTTRQAYQLHGVLKHDLKTVFSSVVKAMGSTLGACGDVNRNVLAPPAVDKADALQQHCAQLAEDIADLLAPQSGAYYDVWLDGEKFMSMTRENPKVTEDRAFNKYGTNFENSPEPIYGQQFLPRKFKVAVTTPGDNSVDILTNDLGVVAIPDGRGGVEGYNLVVGGGMGRSHRNNNTFPLLAEPLGFVKKDDIFHAVKAVVATQRDYGRRDDRKQSRLKYLVHSWGIDKFRTVTEQYLGKPFEDFRPLPEWEMRDYLGWGEDGAGKLWYGVYIQNGRVKGEAKKALRRVIERYELPVILTAQQNIVLTEVEPAWKQDIQDTLAKAGLLPVEDWDPIEAASMACPALPLCGLAVTEAERGLPDINARVRKLMTALGIEDEKMIVRMTGCPNGCARPYMAELGFVGDGPNSYQVWLGGSPNQTRLAEVYGERVKHDDIERELEPALALWRDQRRGGEAFGDFVARKGFDAIRAYGEHEHEFLSPAPKAKPVKPAKAATPKPAAAAAVEKKDSDKAGELLAALSAKAAAEGKTLDEYLAQLLK